MRQKSFQGRGPPRQALGENDTSVRRCSAKYDKMLTRCHAMLVFVGTFSVDSEVGMSNVLNWFEIFVTDMDRAVAFYEAMLGVTLKRETFGGEPHGTFAGDNTGALVLRAGKQPSSDGAVVYFNCNQKLDACLQRAVDAGGRVVVPKTDIGPAGVFGIVVDSEGNAVGLHTNAG